MLSGSHHIPRRAGVVGVVLAIVAGALVGAVAPLAVTPTPARAAAVYGAPSWWNGDCDTVNWTKKARAAGWTGPAASRLGGQVLGIPVCGPRNLAGGPNIWWSRPGWGELEWQCVEFAQRFMIQVYGVEPYQANGVDVVNHYTTAQGGGLVRVNNGTPGVAPQPGDVMSFSSPTNSAGHVAVVASTSVDGSGNGTVLLATQNDTVDGWRTLTVSNWNVSAFGSLYPYAWLHDPLNRGSGGVGGDTSVTEGGFVSYAGNTYRIAGGAPMVVTSWNAMRSVSNPSVVAVDATRWAQLRTYPRDGTFLRDASGSGARWRVVGGVAVPVTDCSANGLDGCPDSVDVDPAAVSRVALGGPFAHLLLAIANGTFVRVGDDGGTGAQGLGTIGRAAGGAILPVADCDDLGGCNPWTNIQAAQWTAYRSAHPTPVDGTTVRLQPSGRFATWSGGRCTISTGTSTSWTDVPDSAVTCGSALRATNPTASALVRGRPTTMSFTASGGAGGYRFAVASGRVPDGTSLATNGVLAGTPTTPGAFQFAVRATDAAGVSATAATLSVTVNAPLTVATTTIPTLQAGRAAAVTLVARGGSGRYVWSAVDPLPRGLVVAPDGLLAGTPAAAGTTSVRLRATDARAPAYGDTVRVTISVG